MTDEDAPDWKQPGESISSLMNALPYSESPGVVAFDGDDLPTDHVIGRVVEGVLMLPGRYLDPDDVLAPRRIVVLDTSRPELHPEWVDDGEIADEGVLLDATWDVQINLLASQDYAALGEMVLDRLIGGEHVFDAAADGERAPGFYDPTDHNNARPGEQRAWLVVFGS